MTPSDVVVLDYGSGNVRSVVRALERVGARVELTADAGRAGQARGLVVPGVGAFASVAEGLRTVGGHTIVSQRLAAQRPVLGVCVGLQVMFERSVEFDGDVPGLAHWPGEVEVLPANVVPHMGWNTVQTPPGSRLFAGVEHERFYFVHSYGVQHWLLPTASPDRPEGEAEGDARVTWAEHGARFVAAVEHGALSATQFHPEKSGDAGAQLLRNWLSTL